MKQQKYGHRTRLDVKPRLTMLARTSNYLLLMLDNLSDVQLCTGVSQ
jgi:hypothetical protein